MHEPACGHLDATGIEAGLLDRLGLTFPGIHTDGAGMASLTGCGIIPHALGGKVAYLGNTSKSGASLALLSKPTRGDMGMFAIWN